MEANHQTRWIRMGAPLMAIVLLATAPHSIAAQAQAPQKATSELQQLKEQLQQVDEVMQELKGQINALEQAQNAGGSITHAPALASASAATEQRGQSPAPQAIEATYSAKADLPAGPIAGSATSVANPHPQGTNIGESTFQVYGFAMLDAGYDFDTNDPNWFDVVRPTKLPAFAGEFAPDGKVYLGVRQTRFGVKSSTPTKFGELKTIFEFELFGVGAEAGETIFRLRHAYGELGHFGAGQNWSVFVDPDAFPNTIEYWGPNGLVWFRNVQFRWMPIMGKNALTIGVERPGATADSGMFADRIELQAVTPKFDLPDLTANARFNRDWGYIQISGLLKRLKWVDLNKDVFNLGGSVVGWGVSVSSSPRFNQNNVGHFQILYGAGEENYMNDAPVDVGIQLNPTNPQRPIQGVALPALGLSTYLDHTWSKKFTSSFGYSMVDIHNSDGQTDDAFHIGYYGSTNLLYTPVNNAMFGAEFIWGRRQNFRDGFFADDYRIQFAFKYNFSKSFSGSDK
jgi:DcaP outer membrane protein